MATCPYKSLVNSVISVCSSVKAGIEKRTLYVMDILGQNITVEI